MIFGILDACRGCLGNLYLGGKRWGAVYESDYCLRMGLFTRDAFVLKTVPVYKSDHCLQIVLFTKAVDVPKAVPVYERRACPESDACLRKRCLFTKGALVSKVMPVYESGVCLRKRRPF